MLVEDPDKRMTLSEAIKHSFITKNVPEEEPSSHSHWYIHYYHLIPSILINLYIYYYSTPFKSNNFIEQWTNSLTHAWRRNHTAHL